MRNLLLAFCCVAVLSFGSCGKRIAKVESIDIVPKPVSMQNLEGVFELTSGTKIVLLSEDSALVYAANSLNDMLQGSFGKSLRLAYASEPLSQAINLCLGDLAPEEYVLSITPEKVEITGGSPAGVFYGVQTLRQLLPTPVLKSEKAGIIELPIVEIADKPHFAYRGGMLDVCRHFFSVDDVKHYIDILAMHKLNRFHWHLTDDQGWRIEIKKYPELTKVGAWRDRCSLEPPTDPNQKDSIPYGGFYTQEEIKDVIRYANERFVTIIPEIEMPGHASAALASYHYLGCKDMDYEVPSIWGVKADVYCAGKDSTFQFLEGVLDEVIELFPSEYIHIGGDECPKDRWKECPLCQQRIKTEKLKDEFELQSYFVKRIEKYLNDKGRKLIGWDEILEGGLSQTASVMSWRGAAGGIEAAKKGNNVVMTPNSHCYLDYYQTDKIDQEPKAIGGFLPLEKVYSLDPYEGLNAEEQKYILGVQGNLWTEFISTLDHAEYMALPRLAAIAEVGWSYDNKESYEGFKKRVTSLRRLYDAAGYNYGKHAFPADSTSTAVVEK